MPLRGVTPQEEDQRFKIMLVGPTAGGKSTAAAQIPYNYIIDMEQGMSRYYKTIQKNHSKVVKTTDWRVVEDEIMCLATEPHPFKTVTIDPITIYWEKLQELWDSKFIAAQTKEDLLQDFGIRYWGKVKKQYRKLRKILMDLDMNVIVIAHEIDKYANQKVVGLKPDSDKKDEFAFDFVFRLDQQGDKYIAQTLKQRIDIGDPQFPERFIWSYDNLTKFYSKEAMEKDTVHSKGGKTKITEPPSIKDTNIPIEAETSKWVESIKVLLKSNKIKQDDFIVFLQDVVEWKIERLADLTQKKVDLIMTNWETKLFPKYKEMKSKEVPPDPQKKRKSKTKPKMEDSKLKDPPDKKSMETEIEKEIKKIDERQLLILQSNLKENNVTEKQFFNLIEIKSWDDVTFDGAEGLIANIQVLITTITNKNKEN